MRGPRIIAANALAADAARRPQGSILRDFAERLAQEIGDLEVGMQGKGDRG